jgi:uncharacterized protein (TIGR02145 family)
MNWFQSKKKKTHLTSKHFDCKPDMTRVNTGKFGYKILLFCVLILVLTSCKKKETNQVQITLATITTIAPTNITASTATIGGNITSNGGGSIYQKGICYSINTNPSKTDSIVYNRDTSNNFTCTLSGLTPNTLYYAKAFAINNAGISYGNQQTFTTLKQQGFPVVVTFSVTGITQDSAICGGDVTNDENSKIIARGVCWSKSQMPAISDSHTTNGTDTGSFTSKISGLSLNTAYYVRAYATNGVGTSYGDQVSFITDDSTNIQSCPGLPSVTYGGKTYHTLLIGTQCWMKENLNIGTRIDGIYNQDPTSGQIEKYCYNDAESYCDTYGGLYQWNEMMQGSATPGAQGICPSGWHIPTNTEWSLLISNLGGVNSAGGNMKSNTGWNNNGNSSNSSGFTAVPAGLRYYYGSFAHLGDYEYFWTSQPHDTTSSWYWNLNYLNTVVSQNFDLNTLGFSVRCIKN